MTNNTQTKEHLGVIIDLSRDALLPEKGKAMLTKPGFYKIESEESPQESFARAATCYSFGDMELAQFIYDAASKHWFTFASPVLSNAVEILWPTFGRDEFDAAGDWLEDNVDPNGMPISCFLSYVPDTKEGLVEARRENAWLSMMGGGIGNFMANRSPDEKSTGVMAHLRGYDADALSYKQTESRRGSIAAYLDIDHPEIIPFIEMRDPTGGDINKKCFNLNNGLNITDKFMEAMIRGEKYELVDPKHGPTGRFLDAREVWEKIMDMRFETGEPYIHFVDTTNRNVPNWITKATYHVRQSNLCSEITLMTSAKRTAVCCLSSLNLEKFDEWKDTPLVEMLTRFLDNVLEYFIRLAPPQLARAVYSASKERAIGIGTLGYHSYLQSKMIPFESGGFNSAVSETHKMYSQIKDRFMAGSKELAAERGEAPDCIGSGMRNSHGLAIAPNASSSSIICVSPSAEPWAANCFNEQGRAGSYLIKNKHLEALLESRGLNTKETWSLIMKDRGSVKNVVGLSDHEKKVFKTFEEIDMQWVIELASARQLYLCQSQSVNMKVGKNTTKQQMSDLHVLAWIRGLKSLYYLRAEKAKKTSTTAEQIAQPLNRVEVDFEGCLSCQG